MTIYVTEGVGRCERRGGAVEEIRPGDRVFFEPDEDPTVHWGAHVSDDEYTAAPAARNA